MLNRSCEKYVGLSYKKLFTRFSCAQFLYEKQKAPDRAFADRPATRACEKKNCLIRKTRKETFAITSKRNVRNEDFFRPFSSSLPSLEQYTNVSCCRFSLTTCHSTLRRNCHSLSSVAYIILCSPRCRKNLLKNPRSAV